MPEQEGYDLSKAKVYSGKPLTPLENAQVREVLENLEWSRRWKKGVRVWSFWVLGVPTVAAGVITGGKVIISLVAWLYSYVPHR